MFLWRNKKTISNFFVDLPGDTIWYSQAHFIDCHILIIGPEGYSSVYPHYIFTFSKPIMFSMTIPGQPKSSFVEVYLRGLDMYNGFSAIFVLQSFCDLLFA